MLDQPSSPPYPEAFAALGVRPSILRALSEEKFVTPTDIQSLLIPRALAGVDLLGQARTGTGKTAAFAIPILQRADRDGATQAIILVPTRELSVQVEAEIARLSRYTPIRSVAVYGGQKIAAQLKTLRHNPQVVVGTPGRVIDLLDRRLLNFNNLRFVVLDEVDRMLDIGFRDDIRNILSRAKRQDDGSGAGIQTIFVSATIAGEIEKLARTYMREPVEKLIAPGSDDKPTVAEVKQWYVSVQPWDKYRLLRKLLEREQPDLAIVFCRTKHGAGKVAHRLEVDGFSCREIHGNLAQNKRDKVMKNFRGGKFEVLVATDLASRGIDVLGISHIINYDVPEDPEVYIHRIGRTARMGAEGRAIMLVTPEQGEELTKIETLINMLIPVTTVEGFNPSPPPSDWLETDPHTHAAAPAPQTDSAPAEPARKLTIGSKIPLSRRHRRRR
jgi:ATP-dependent RNA helicase DeaD